MTEVQARRCSDYLMSLVLAGVKKKLQYDVLTPVNVIVNIKVYQPA